MQDHSIVERRREYEKDDEMKKIDGLNNEKGKRKWQSMALEMKIEEIVCLKKEVPARCGLRLIRGPPDEFRDRFLERTDFSQYFPTEVSHLKKKCFEVERKDWNEKIRHHFHALEFIQVDKDDDGLIKSGDES
ncbi:hypothetical protein Tco_0952194 [Tanacetum coccineum]|uniref:Uncharacterized protein n=1 Tax=Tanacetum coccineum TaxID=301880 RepID=A0ABQ5E2Z8_9ASTR